MVILPRTDRLIFMWTTFTQKLALCRHAGRVSTLAVLPGITSSGLGPGTDPIGGV